MQDDGVPNILVVDDEHRIADTLCTVLRIAGHSAAAAYSGEQALEAAQLHPPDMLITDVIMPGMNGFDLAIQITRTWPACGVLLFSCEAAATRLEASARRAGYSFELLEKPVHPTEFIARANRLLHREMTSCV